VEAISHHKSFTSTKTVSWCKSAHKYKTRSLTNAHTHVHNTPNIHTTKYSHYTPHSTHTQTHITWMVILQKKLENAVKLPSAHTNRLTRVQKCNVFIIWSISIQFFITSSTQLKLDWNFEWALLVAVLRWGYPIKPVWFLEALHEMTSWPPSWKYDVTCKIRLSINAYLCEE